MSGYSVPLTLFLLVVPACYNPGYTGQYTCDPAQQGSDCPDGWQCLAGRCAPPGTTIDLAVDLSADLAPPPDLAPASPCTQSGTQVLQNSMMGIVWACNGDFSTDQERDKLCTGNASYHVCGKDMMRDMDLLGKLDNVLCNGLSGFYIINHDASLLTFTPPYMAKCDPMLEKSRILLGCGSSKDRIDLDGMGCNGAHQALLCFGSRTMEGWFCDPDVGLTTASYKNAARLPGGVLCCQDLP